MLSFTKDSGMKIEGKFRESAGQGDSPPPPTANPRQGYILSSELNDTLPERTGKSPSDCSADIISVRGGKKKENNTEKKNYCYVRAALLTNKMFSRNTVKEQEATHQRKSNICPQRLCG